MKKSIALIVFAAFAVLNFASCTQNGGEASSAAKSEQTAVSSTEQAAVNGRDMRITIENEFDTNKYAKQMANATKIVSESQYRFGANSVSDFYENATDIIECEVIDTHFAIFSGDAYTVADVKVLDSILGGLSKGDIISVVTYGGYVSEYEDTLATDPDGAAKLSVAEVKKQKENIYCKKIDWNEDFIQSKTKYVFVLIATNSINRSYEFFSGAYGSMSWDMTIYKDIGNGRYARWPNTYLEKHGDDETENSIECFTVDWLKDELKKAAEKSSGTNGK